MRRALLCTPLQSGDFIDPPGDAERERAMSRPLAKWQDLWTPPGDPARRLWVRASGPAGTETIDAREWIETLHDRKRWPSGTVFEIAWEAS